MSLRRLHIKRKPPKVKRIVMVGGKLKTEYHRLQLDLDRIFRRGSSTGDTAISRHRPTTSKPSPSSTSTEFRDVDNTSKSKKKNSHRNILPDVFSEQVSCLRYSPHHNTYQERKKKLHDRWEILRPLLIKTRIEEMAPATNVCGMCDSVAEEIIFCGDCGKTAYYCETCCHRVHRNIMFHTPQRWKGNLYIPENIERTLCRRDNHDCGQLYTSTIHAVDCKGTRHLYTVTLCRCEESCLTLLRYNLWPATPMNPQIAFDIQLMELLAVLQMECHLPAKSFCNALGVMKNYFIHRSAPGQDIYRALVGDCLAEYNFHRTSLKTRHTISEATIGRECPVCQKTPPIISMDANFGLVHKLSSGKGHGREASRHKDVFFPQHEHYAKFVEKYCSDRGKERSDCSNFQAGNVIRSKIKNGKLDVTGIFAAVCKHDIPLNVLDMSHGERLAYPVYILNQLMTGGTENLVVMYDIACLLHKHLLKVNSEDILTKCSFAVPVFHSFAHNLSCQLQYGQRYATGTGLTDGEGIERLWSYLRRFKKITKEMSLDNRHDLLTEALLHHTDGIIWKMADRLNAKILKAENIITEYGQILRKIVEDQRESATAVETWSNDWKAQCRTKGDKAGTLTADERYCECLQKLKATRELFETADNVREIESLQKDISRLINESKKLQKRSDVKDLDISKEPGVSILASAKVKRRLSGLRQLKELATERQYLSGMMKKYADGQGVGLRISRHFATNTSKIKKTLTEMKSECSMDLDFSSISTPSSIVFSELQSQTLTLAQQKAVEASSFTKHAEEEIERSKNEIISFLTFLSCQSETILREIRSLQGLDHSRYAMGKTHYLLIHHLALENIWNYSETLLKTHVPNSNIQFSNIVDNLIQQKETVSALDVPVLEEVLDTIFGENFENYSSSDDDENEDDDDDDDDDDEGNF